MYRLSLFTQYKFAHSSKAWFKQHINDEFVKKAGQLNYRSRAAFKLQEIQQKYNILGQRVIDLGSAPGSWSQYAVRYRIQSKENLQKQGQNKVVSVDLLDMKPIEGVDFYKCDARDRSLHKMLIEKYGYFDSIISDMAPNFSGVSFETHEQILGLNKMCVKLSLQLSNQKCGLVMKTTQGQHSKIFYEFLQILFQEAYRFKPKASRSESKEFYLVCKNFRKQYFDKKKYSLQKSQQNANKFKNLQAITQHSDEQTIKKEQGHTKSTKLRKFINNQFDNYLLNRSNRRINKKQLKKIIDQYINLN